MKLLRYGRPGKERPGVLDADGKIRDLSEHVGDIAGAVLAPAALKKLAKIDPKTLPAGARQSAPRPLRRRHGKIHLHRPQLFRPRGGDRRHGSAGADHLHEGDLGNRRPRRRRADPARLEEDRLGSRARRRHRQGCEIRLRGRGAGLCGRLLRRQRRVGTRLPGRAPGPVDQGQELRHVRPDRPLAGHQGRGRRTRRTSRCG